MVDRELFKSIKEIPIQSIISRYVKLKKSGSTYEGLCPFHTDKHTGSFKVNPRKNRWNCYACGIYGDATDFVSRIEGISAKHASIRIAEMEGLISHAEAEDLLEGKSIQKKQVKKREAIQPNQKREDRHCEAVYKAFVRACDPLSDAHYEHLKQVRKIEDAHMDLFFEWPKSSDPEFWARFSQELLKEGILEGTTMAVRYVPGFAYDGIEEHPYFMNGEGIGIKLFDRNGVLRGLQLRQDKVKVGARYKLFSSGWAEENREEEPNKIDGCSAKQVPDIVYPKKDRNRLAITEGKFKALQLQKYGYTVLSVNGVNSWSSVLDDLLEVGRQKGIKEVHILFDADMEEKRGVASAGLALSEAIEAAGFESAFILWDAALGKGVDDMLLAGHVKQLKKVSGAEERKVLLKTLEQK